MKNLIRKILKEENDEFEWVRGFDTKEVEKQIRKKFNAAEYEYSFEGERLYDMLVEAGIKDIDKLQEIGELIYDEASSLYERGVDSGRDSCDCDGCCDDYVYYEDHRNDVREAKEEGDEEGYGRGLDDARSESESEIEGLKSRIEELESQLNETVNKKNTKRI
jgi:hypothetical protein